MSHISERAHARTIHYPIRDHESQSNIYSLASKNYTYSFRLEIKRLASILPALGTIDKCLINDRSALRRRRGNPVSIRRNIDNPSVLIAGGLGGSNERREQELREVEMPKNVGAELHVMVMRCYDIHGGQHDSSRVEQRVEPCFLSNEYECRISSEPVILPHPAVNKTMRNEL